MQLRRRTPLFSGATPAITPTSAQPTTGVQTRSELVAQVLDLKCLLRAERQRNAKIERVLVQQLDTLQNTLDALREAYISEKAPKPTGRQQ